MPRILARHTPGYICRGSFRDTYITRTLTLMNGLIPWWSHKIMALLGSGEEEGMELSWRKQLIGGVALGALAFGAPPWYLLLGPAGCCSASSLEPLCSSHSRVTLEIPNLFMLPQPWCDQNTRLLIRSQKRGEKLSRVLRRDSVKCKKNKIAVRLVPGPTAAEIKQKLWKSII